MAPRIVTRLTGRTGLIIVAALFIVASVGGLLLWQRGDGSVAAQEQPKTEKPGKPGGGAGVPVQVPGGDSYATAAMLVSRRRNDIATLVARTDMRTWKFPALVTEAKHCSVLAGELVHAPVAMPPLPPVCVKLIELVSQATKEVEQRESVAGLQLSE